MYADELIKRLQNKEVGCHFGHMYAGAICYADDTAILSPSVKGLQKMLSICEEYGAEFDVLYNDKKTKCIKFSRSRTMSDFSVYLNGNLLECVPIVNHLGIKLSFNFDEKVELSHKRGDFIGRCNYILNNTGQFPVLFNQNYYNRIAVICTAARLGIWLIQIFTTYVHHGI
mgnify:CR=1 FL=1